MYIYGLKEIKDLILPAVLTRIISESLDPIISMLEKHTDQPEQTLKPILWATRLRTSIKNAIEEMATRKGNDPVNKESRQYRITRTFAKIPVAEVERAINEALAGQTAIAKRYGLLGKTLIIDQKEKPAWHKVHTEYLVSINPKKKANHKGHRFYVGAFVGKIALINSYIIDNGRIAREEVVERALTKAEKFSAIERILIDAGFFKRDVYRVIWDSGSNVLGAVPKNSLITRIIMGHHRSLSHHYEPGLYSYSFGDVSFRLLVVPRPKEKRRVSNDHDVRRIVKNYVSLAVFRVPEGIPGEFRTRGGRGLAQLFKEWAYRTAEDYRKRAWVEVLLRLESLVGARIGAHYASLRFFVFGLELVSVNIYMLLDGIFRFFLFLPHGLSVRLTAIHVCRWVEKIGVLRSISFLSLNSMPISSKPPPKLEAT